MEKSKILVIDDEEIICELLIRTLGEKGYGVDVAEDGEVAIEKTKGSFFNLLITDLKMPKVNGMEVLKEIKKVNPYIEVIIITGYPTIESAVEAIKMGAFNFICKPFDMEELLSIVTRCMEEQKFATNHLHPGELMALFEISKTITTTTNLDLLLRRILNSALEITKAKRGSLLMLNDETKELNIKVAQGLDKEIIRNTQIKLGEGISGKVAKEGKPILVNNVEEDARFHQRNRPQYETKSFLNAPLASIPLHSQGSVLGVINISDKISGESFTEREKILLSILIAQAAIAIEYIKSYDQFQHKIKVLRQTIKQLKEA